MASYELIYYILFYSIAFSTYQIIICTL